VLYHYFYVTLTLTLMLLTSQGLFWASKRLAAVLKKNAMRTAWLGEGRRDVVDKSSAVSPTSPSPSLIDVSLSLDV